MGIGEWLAFGILVVGGLGLLKTVRDRREDADLDAKERRLRIRGLLRGVRREWDELETIYMGWEGYAPLEKLRAHLLQRLAVVRREMDKTERDLEDQKVSGKQRDKLAVMEAEAREVLQEVRSIFPPLRRLDEKKDSIPPGTVIFPEDLKKLEEGDW